MVVVIDLLLMAIWVYGVYLQSRNNRFGLWVIGLVSFVFCFYQIMFGTNVLTMYVIAFGVLFVAGVIFSGFGIKQSEKEGALDE